MVCNRRRRPRGFAPWNPQTKTRIIIEQVAAILEDYRLVGILPITLRQMFYRMVVLHAFSKTEQAYKRLGETLNRARRARIIEMDDIRDDGFNMIDPIFYDDVAGYWSAVRHSAETYRIDRQAGQERRLVLWCEAAGMQPQLANVGDEYGVSAASSGGFDSTTIKHSIGRMLAASPTTVIHIGDLDPSGVHMFGSLDEDVTAFAEEYGGDVEFVRLAVLPEHIEEYGLPTSPPKPTDKRKFDDDRTVQAEALDPVILAAMAREAIIERTDMDVYDKALALEAEQRAELLSKLEAFEWGA
jgi:hypothetical protein